MRPLHTASSRLSTGRSAYATQAGRGPRPRPRECAWLPTPSCREGEDEEGKEEEAEEAAAEEDQITTEVNVEDGDDDDESDDDDDDDDNDAAIFFSVLRNFRKIKLGSSRSISSKNHRNGSLSW